MSILIVYYSRTGVTRKAGQGIRDAFQAAGVADVEVVEIADAKKRSGVIAFARSCIDAMLGRVTTIEVADVDVAAYDLVVIGTPVWAGKSAPAATAFCRQYCGGARKIAFFCTMGASGDKGAFQTLERACGRPAAATLSLIDKAVKSDDGAGYLVRVRDFAEGLAATRTEPTE